jgi:hypothetical protein
MNNRQRGKQRKTFWGSHMSCSCCFLLPFIILLFIAVEEVLLHQRNSLAGDDG